MEKNKGIFPFRKHPVGDFHDGKKGRKRKGGRLRRSMGFLMAAVLIFNTLPASGLAVSASEQEKGLCEHHTEHTAECGYAEAQPCTHEHTEEKHSGEECYKTVTECVHEHTDECYPETEETEESTGKGNATSSDAGNREPSLCTHVCSEESGCITKILDCHHEHDESCGYQEAQDCGYVCEICNGTEPEDTGENTENTEAAGTDTAECICEILCTEDSINGDCPVCGTEDADLSRCKGEKTEEQEKTGEKVITAWEWIDPEEYLTDGILALPGAGRENPAFVEDVTALLPEKIQAKVAAVNAAEDGEETEEDAEAAPETEDAEITLTGWKCASYPEDGAYEGTYTFTAFLPEGFVLAEDAAALEVEVELGGGEMLEGEVSVTYQEASWNGSEVTYTGKTENCTSVEGSTEAVTWNAGWYVVNSSVTVSEPVTVTGAVNLILADGCTLDAQKGIVVGTGNSLTIYAQSGGTGTLNATGTDSAGIGGDGKTNAGVDGGSSGAITIHGGNITATSQNGAGIGGGAPWSGAKGGSGSNITIYGGSVTAASTDTGTGGAGIGGGGGDTGGGTGENINIYGGTVNATGGNKGAGIGGGGAGIGGTSGAGTNITVSGGNVTAVGGDYAAGIGGGGGYSTQYGSCTGGAGSVTITGGIVDASSPTDVYYADYKGDPIGNGGNTTATATVDKTTAIVFENGTGTVCGDVTLDGSYTLPADYTLNIPVGASLSGSGTLSGGNAFTTENLTVDMISVPEDWHYTGEDLTEKIKGAVSLNGEITICGQTFTASTDGWELSVEKVSELEYTVKYTHTDKGTLSKTVTIARGQTALSDVMTYKEDGTTPANTFSVGETIIVKATATFPANNAIMAAAEFDTPTGEQMAVYYNDTQISAPSTVENGVHTMTVDTSNLPESALNKEIALTVKYIESDNASGATATTNVTVTAAARVEKDSTTTYVGALANAFTEGNSGATVTLLSEVDLGNNYISIRESNTFTLDLNGQTVKASYYDAFDISGGSLTIQDSGTGGKIESSDITIEVTGGTLSIQSGTVSGHTGVQISSGAVNISGGTISGSDTGLKVTGGGNIAISGGTFSGVIAVEIHSNASVTLKDLLAAGYAYHQNDIPVANAAGPGGEVPLDAKPAWLTGTVTVKECNHTGGLVPSENGYQHGGPCKCCGAELTAANHTLGADNQCSGCGAALAAKVEKSGSDTVYVEASGLEAAFAKNSGNDGATFTLLANVEPNTCLTIQINCILNLGGHTITGYIGSSQCVCVDKNTAVTIRGEGEIISPNGIALAVDGNATLEGGTYTSTGSEDFSHGVYVGQSATLSVTGEKVSIRNTSGGNGLVVVQAQSVRLSAGTYSGATEAISNSEKLSDMLAHTDNTRYAYYQNDIPVTKASAWVDGNIGDVPLDTPIAWLSDTVTVKACNHAGEGVCTYTHNENTSTHTKTCLACGKTWDAEDCAYTFSGGTGTCAACGDSVTVTVSGTDGLIYDGTEKEPGVTVMRGETALTAGTDYTVAYTDNKNAGENKATVAVTIGNGQGNYIQNFTIGRAALTIKANDQTITYGVSIAAGTDQVTPDGLCTGDTLEGVTLSASSVNVPGGTITPSGAVIKRSGKDVTANYNINYMPGTLTINRAQGTLMVPAGPVAKIFGDGQFLLGCSTNGDGKISYASSDENVASVSADGNVLIKGAGETVITVSLAAGTNYTGAESQEVRITVAKEAAPAIPGETRNYTYLNGSHGAVTIDVAGKLPKDRGETTYTAATTDGKGILSGVSMDQDGNLVYTVEANKAIGDTAVITVTAVMANYEDTAYNVTIKLVEKKTVEPQDGGSVSVKDGCILIYGQTLSDLTLENVIFVEQGTQKQVEGTLAWSDPSHVPEVADRTAQWVFTPKDNKEYEQLTGTAAITVVKATPETEAPEAAAVTYHPAGTLGSVGLNGGGAAWTVGGSAVTVEGTWGWKEPSAIPAVKNSGYTAVFTPKDTANYDTVERTVAVTVAKAEPYIATPPTAAQITYGDTLDASTLTDGTVQYSSSDSTAVTGSFAWKDGSIKPDSGSAAYTVVFTPADSTDYSSVETQVTLVTGKAENAPDMPPSAMDVARRFEKVGDVGLPEGWQWQDTDRDTALETGVPVTATAVYTGADRDNYRNVTVSVAITRADCDHEHTETRNAVTATCQRKGYTGDTWCLNCGELLAKGTETDLADHSGGTATCISGKVCQVCGTEYTGKDSANHMHTEIRGAIKAGCTSDGYTGDTYCTDCGAKTDSGRAVPAAGHDWHVTREEAATTTSEGRRIYTCGECGQTREESIPKLPQPSHTHSYSPRETTAATCRSNGVITYSCSCGDSYTQNTAALGHSYRSEVTKQPTVSAEGVMTYTCGRCGHSYTRPIAKLPDTGIQQPGTQQPGDTEPGSGSAEETRPDTGIPFIKDEDGKTGWDVIRAEEEKAREGSTINVDMNGTTVVPGDIFDSIKGRDITVTFDMGGGILWSVDGKSITGDVSSPDVSSPDKAGDINFSVKTETNAIPADIVNNVTGERYSIQISLAHEGEFGFTAVLSIGLGRENAGYTASLYYYNESTGELEFICKDQVAEDGAVSLAFTHASDYVIAIDGEEESGSVTEPAQPEDQDADSTGASEESPQTGQAWRLWWLIVAGTLVIIVGIGVFFVVRKKGHGE